MRWLLAPFCWRYSHTAGAWAYFENTLTKARKAERATSGGHSPVDLAWLSRGSPDLPQPPVGGSAVR